MTITAPWLLHYDAGVPATLAPYPQRTLLDYLDDSVRARPQQAALLYKGATLTYRDLDTLSDALASAFRHLGVRTGDRVALLLPNCPQFFIAQFAAWKIGAIIAPLSPIYTEQELEAPLCDNGVETIVTLTRYYERVKRVQSRTPLTRVIATNIKEYFPPLLRLLFTLAREKRDGDRTTLEPRDHELARLLREHRGRTVERAVIATDDHAVLLMSGGTTGTPKGVLGTHGAYVFAGLQEAAWMSPALRPDTDVIFLPLPLFHVYGHVGVQSLALINHSPLAIVPNPRDIPDLITTIRRVRPAFFNGVPALYIALLNHPDVQRGKVDFKSIKLCMSGAAPLMAETKLRFESITGGRIVEGYSLTEAMMALCINPVKGPNKLGSVGMPLPDVQVRIFDGDEGTRVMPAGEVGEIAIRGASVDRSAIGTGPRRRPASSAITLTKTALDAGCTLATSAFSTPTAMSSSWTARKTSSRRAVTRSGRGRSRRCWPRIRPWRKWASPASGTTCEGRRSRPGSCCGRRRPPPTRNCGRSAAESWPPIKCRHT